ncbi:MAG: DUF6448 family protein [Candidatus Bathyarchaeia archaeon]
MPPHCDTMDGPVVTAARKALEKGNVNLILPWVPKKAEAELKKAFEKALRARKRGKEAAEVADYWFFETAVRLHREGEGAPYTGLKPAGLDWGPVVPKAERAIKKGDPSAVINLINRAVEKELQKRFKHVMAKKKYEVNDVTAAREYVQANLGFVLYAHHLYANITGGGEHAGEETKGMGGHEH